MQAGQKKATVLGKRTSRSDSTFPEDALPSHLLTPESTPNPKRAKTTATILDDDSNKENIPPLLLDAINRVPRTPRRTRTDFIRSPTTYTPRRRASSSDLNDISSLRTPPTTPPQLQPIHLRVRSLLRTTCNGVSAIAGRDDERDVILNFIRSFASAENSMKSTLYISGSPGTGKTALVNSIINTIEEEYKVLYVNCMALESLSALFMKMSEELGESSAKPSRGKKAKGRDSRDALMSLLNQTSIKCVFVLDELDHVATSTQDLTSLFEVAHLNCACTRIIGIANTHTLTTAPQVLGMESENVKTLHFAPYTADQMIRILRARLSPLTDDSCSADILQKFLPMPALNLLCRKIAAQTGDVRALFEVLRVAIDGASMGSSESTTGSDSNNPLSTTTVVTPSHILAALKTYTPSKSKGASTAVAPQVSSEIVTKIRDLGLQPRLVILSILLASRRLEANLSITGSATSSPTRPFTKRGSSSMAATDIEPTSLHSYYTAVLKRSSDDVFTPVSRSEFSDLLGLLETTGLVSMSLSGSPPTSPVKGGRRAASRSFSFAGSTKVAKYQSVRLAAGIRVDEVLRGLGISEIVRDSADPLQEEVNAIWTRETVRTAREANSTSKKAADVFDDAVED